MLVIYKANHYTRPIVPSRSSSWLTNRLCCWQALLHVGCFFFQRLQTFLLIAAQELCVNLISSFLFPKVVSTFCTVYSGKANSEPLCSLIATFLHSFDPTACSNINNFHRGQSSLTGLLVHPNTVTWFCPEFGCRTKCAGVLAGQRLLFISVTLSQPAGWAAMSTVLGTTRPPDNRHSVPPNTHT